MSNLAAARDIVVHLTQMPGLVNALMAAMQSGETVGIREAALGALRILDCAE